MHKLLNASFIYMALGVASGLFYREFTILAGLLCLRVLTTYSGYEC